MVLSRDEFKEELLEFIFKQINQDLLYYFAIHQTIKLDYLDLEKFKFLVECKNIDVIDKLVSGLGEYQDRPLLIFYILKETIILN